MLNNELILDENISEELYLILEDECKEKTRVSFLLLNPEVEHYEAAINILSEIPLEVDLLIFRNNGAPEIYSTINALRTAELGFNSYDVLEYKGNSDFLKTKHHVNEMFNEFVTFFNKQHITNVDINLNYISKYFKDDDGSIISAFSGLVKRYKSFNEKLFDAFISANVFTKNELLITHYSSDIARCQFKELSILKDYFTRYSSELKPYSSSLYLHLKNINQNLDLTNAFKLHNENDYETKLENIETSYLWMSSYFYNLAHVYINNNLSSLAYLHAFRMLEAFVDSFLLKKNIMKISYFRGEGVKFSINNEKIKGFGAKWYVFKKIIKNEYGINISKNSVLNTYVTYRNDLCEVHGFGKANTNMAKQFMSECVSVLEIIENKIWFTDKYWSSFNSFISKIFFYNLAEFFLADLYVSLGYTSYSEK